MIGSNISHYQILLEIGQGGMGVVFKALDTHLDRQVALKFLPPHLSTDTEAKARFIHEAKAASSLDHPNICTIYDIDEAEDGRLFIAMAYYEGSTLDDVLTDGPLESVRAVELATQIADALSCAHDSGIVHRDIKPGNIILTKSGLVKILDFGLAKLSHVTKLTVAGSTLGTASYMSPEQARGEDVNYLTDIWSLGVVLYELLTGQLPFTGAYEAAIAYGILNTEPSHISEVNPSIPVEISDVIHRAIQKDPGSRYASMDDFKTALLAVTSGTATIPVTTSMPLWRSPQVLVPTSVGVIAIIFLFIWWSSSQANVRWAYQVGLPEIRLLVKAKEYRAAFDLAREVENYIPEDTSLANLRPKFSQYLSFDSDPSGADVSAKFYTDVESEWRLVGQTPIDSLIYPKDQLRIKIEKDGFEPVERHVQYHERLDATWVPNITLYDSESEFSNMVLLLGSTRPGWNEYSMPAGLDTVGFKHLAPFLIDQYEVSNRDFKEFVDANGYENESYWNHPFIRDGTLLSWDQGIQIFTDRTGRSGPSTWQVQDYPEGQDDYPVTGVSWYEAAAYAEFVGKKLPTLYHWSDASQFDNARFMIPQSNLNGSGPSARNEYQGISSFGLYDIAGNAREWVENASRNSEERFILGGGWNSPIYGFTDAGAQLAFDRSETNGFRCMVYLDENPNQAALSAPILFTFRDYYAEEPVDDIQFNGFLRQFLYDRTDLNEQVEMRDTSNVDWVKEVITFDAAYGGEQMIAHLFLPKRSVPPYQTVVFFPGTGAIDRKDASQITMRNLDFIVRDGRAFVYPIYKSTFERRDGLTTDGSWGDDTIDYRNHVIMWTQDLQRTIDYLETRPSDFDNKRLAYYGFSWGAQLAPIMTVIESRFTASILNVAGLSFSRPLPEVDPFNYLPRVKIPTLMISGRWDESYPLDSRQRPFFEHLGTPDEHKDHYIAEAQHIVPYNEVVAQTLAWLDRYLGPVH